MSIAVLQARTNSSRLPAKVLLPMGGLPLVVLAAKRAGNTGKNILVATSHESSDDSLAEIVKQHGLELFRGNLNNTLERFVEALAVYSDDTVVFRLTADNVFPDGALLDEMETDFRRRGLDYLCIGDESGLPYGMSVEVMWLRGLREAFRNATTSYEREHVTPYLIKRFGRSQFTKYASFKKGLYRCTVDHIDDYLSLQKLFLGIDEPVEVSGIQLVQRLASNDLVVSAGAASKLIVGGAQIGLEYGIANTTGRPSIEVTEDLIKTAVANGVTTIDTARAYGTSEDILGKVLGAWASHVEVVTKLDPLDSCSVDATPCVVNAFVDASIYESCVRLKKSKLPILMLHRADHVYGWRGSVWQRLLTLQQDGRIERLGCSVQSPQELIRVINEPDIKVVQFPFHILDYRWSDSLELLCKAKKERELTVHVRSVFLQGLLLRDDAELWLRANCSDHQSVFIFLNECAQRWHRKSVADLCLAYVRSQTWIDGIIIGMDNKEQLLNNLMLFDTQLLSSESLKCIDMSRPLLSSETLNPANWSRGD